MAREIAFCIEGSEFQDETGGVLTFPDPIHIEFRSDGAAFDIEDVQLPGAGAHAGRYFPAPRYYYDFLKSWASSNLKLGESSLLRQAYYDRVSLHGREDRADSYADYVREQRMAAA